MLTQVAEGVLVHQSEVLRNNTVVVQGRTGVLLVDAGITGVEMACLARDLSELGQPVAAGFSTHPDWDHVLWHPDLGDVPRYGTAPLRRVPGGPALEAGLGGRGGRRPEQPGRQNNRSVGSSRPRSAS